MVAILYWSGGRTRKLTYHFSLSLSLSLSLQMAACFAGLSTCLNLGLVTQRRRFHDKKREEEEEEEREARMEAKAVEATSQ